MYILWLDEFGGVFHLQPEEYEPPEDATLLRGEIEKLSYGIGFAIRMTEEWEWTKWC